MLKDLLSQSAKQFEELYKVLSVYFREYGELCGKATVQYGKPVIPDKAIYQKRDKAIEYVEAFCSS